MTRKTKGRTERHGPKKNDYADFTATDPLAGWLVLLAVTVALMVGMAL